MHKIIIPNWKTATTVPKGIFFGCFGNPIKSTTLICKCADTPERHLKNYKKYLYHQQNYGLFNMTKTKSDNLDGYYIFGYDNSMTKIEYPDELK